MRVPLPTTLRHQVRDAIARTLYAVGLLDPERRVAGRLTVVTFHRVLPAELIREYSLAELCVTPEELEWYLRFFHRYFDVRTLSDARERLDDEGPHRRPLLAVTFDDGQRDNWTYARPVLERERVRATFFVPAQNIEEQQALWHDRLADAVRALLGDACGLARLRAVLPGDAWNGTPLGPAEIVEGAKSLPRAERVALVEAVEQAAGQEAITRPEWDGMMTWDELAKLAEGGHEIGAHSMSHPILPLCADEELEWEAGESRRLIEERLGCSVRSFCYPNGSWDGRTLDAVRSHGFRWGVTTAPGLNGPETPPLLLQRFNMDAAEVRSSAGSLCEALLAWRISGSYPRSI